MNDIVWNLFFYGALGILHFAIICFAIIGRKQHLWGWLLALIYVDIRLYERHEETKTKMAEDHRDMIRAEVLKDVRVNSLKVKISRNAVVTIAREASFGRSVSRKVLTELYSSAQTHFEDEWGRSLQFTIEPYLKVAATSAGPDGVFKSEDDFTIHSDPLEDVKILRNFQKTYSSSGKDPELLGFWDDERRALSCQALDFPKHLQSKYFAQTDAATWMNTFYFSDFSKGFAIKDSLLIGGLKYLCLQEDDVIIGVNNQEVRTSDKFQLIQKQFKELSTINLKYLRGDKELAVVVSFVD